MSADQSYQQGRTHTSDRQGFISLNEACRPVISQWHHFAGKPTRISSVPVQTFRGSTIMYQTSLADASLAVDCCLPSASPRLARSRVATLHAQSIAAARSYPALPTLMPGAANTVSSSSSMYYSMYQY
jgi:hypothetical protein